MADSVLTSAPAPTLSEGIAPEVFAGETVPSVDVPAPAPLAAPPAPDAGAFTLPNAVTLAGAALTAWWLRGGPKWAAVAGLLADEIDGRLARATGTTSRIGATLDWATDVSLNAVVMDRLGLAAALPVVLPVQVAMHAEGIRPAIGSLRAVSTLALLWKQMRDERAVAEGARPNPSPARRRARRRRRP